MRKIPRLRSIAAIAGALCALIGPAGAAAYSEETHQRIVEAAVEAMIAAEQAPVPPVPAGVNPTEWNAYTARLKASSGNLQKLKAGLPGAFRMTFEPDPSATIDAVTYNDPEICKYHGSNQPPRDFNLLNAANIQIGDFTYYANKAYVPCAYTPLPGPTRTQTPQGGALGPTLGWQAQSIDARVNDTVLWARPTNAGVAGLQKEMANRVVELGLGAALVPFVCLAELIFDGGCDIQDSFDLATRINPITLVEGLLPGVGPITSTDFVGVWHFIDVGASVNRYNDVRGLLYEGAGPSHPGALDLGIMALADISGLSLNAFSSEGPERYGQFDRVERTVTQWQAHTIGHTEFSSVANLARSGWDAYVADPTTARYLSWPLHAVGDAAAPHHVTGTTGWGHRPFEDAIEGLDQRKAVLPAFGESSFLDFRDRVLRIGFNAFRSFQSDPSIQAFITREARSTRDIATADGDWVFKDGPSLTYLTSKADADAVYVNELHRVQPFVDQAVGHTIALLARAGELARDPGFDSQTLCPVGGHFTGEGTGCADGPVPPPPPVGPLPFGLSQVLLFCQPENAVCSVNGDCCDDVPCTSGTCHFPPPSGDPK